MKTGAKSTGSWGVLALALVIGVIAFWLAHNYLNSKEASLRERLLGSFAETRQVVVARGFVQPGDKTGPQNMAVADVPAKHLSADSVTPDDFHLYEGQVVRHGMSPGEPLLTHFLAGDAINRFSELLNRGERAITVQVSELASSAGMMKTGDFIDLFVLTEDQRISSQSSGEKVLLMLRERVRVLAVGQDPLRSKEQDFVVPDRRNDGRYATVTIGVPRDDAARISLAEGMGELVFLLRSPEDQLMHGDQLLAQSLLWNELSSKQGIQYFGSKTNKNGVLQPSYFATESVGKQTLRHQQKSVAVAAAVESE